jgi:hypothetical protein
MKKKFLVFAFAMAFAGIASAFCGASECGGGSSGCCSKSNGDYYYMTSHYI